jgi:succinate dehydrogenase/fumarate reductase flavoprotein subunit
MNKPPGTEVNPDCDVIVVGGGLAGVVAALEAAEHGKRVTIIEAAAELGGTAIYSGGLLHIWNVETLEEYLVRCPTADRRFARVLVDNYRPLVHWLESDGAPGRYSETTFRGQTFKSYSLGNSLTPRRKRGWFTFMYRRLTQMGVRMLLKTRARSLVRDPNGAVVGVVAENSDAELTVLAPAVVLALGGFQSNPELLQHYMGDGAADAVPRSVAFDVGDGLGMALEAGAALTDSMEYVYGHLMPASPCKIRWENYLDQVILSAYYAEYGIVLNSRGERFVDEGAGEYTALTANAGLQQPPGGLWIVMDHKVRTRYARFELPWSLITPLNLRYASFLRFMGVRRRKFGFEFTIDSLKLAKEQGALVLEAGTVRELAARLGREGVDPDRALSTIEEFDRHVENGRGGELSVPRTRSANRIHTPPFYAIKCGVGVSMTYGGVKVNEAAAVLDSGGAPIPGLFAAPGTAGGIHHLYYGGALAACGVFGRVAGCNAARYASGT